jgi:hypothetical protein
MYWLIAASIALAWLDTPPQGADQEKQAEPGQTATSQPASEPADAQSTFRKPEQARILEELLRQKERPRPILPSHLPSERRPGRGSGPGEQTLLLEGTPLVERPGRYVVADGRPLFVFRPDDSTRAPQSMEILKNQYLEIMEDEAKTGVSEFVVSAEVTSYRGQNYLLLHKVLRRVPNRNLSP